MDENSGVWGKVQRVRAFVLKYPALFVLILVLVLQFVPNGNGAYPWGGMWMRMQSEKLHVADSAAASSVDNFLAQQADALARQQYPNLPEANRQKVVEDLKKKVREEAGEQLESERKRLAQEIRDHYSYEVDGRKFLYMPDIDPYFYLRYARNVVEKGHFYDVLKDGEPWDNHMVAPIGTTADQNWHPYVFAWMYRIFSVFDEQITLMQAANYFPIVFIFLSLIFTFFIAQKVSGNLGGFFAVTILALLPAVMSRTPWGHADTDAYNVFFPVVVVWLLFMALSSSTLKKQAVWAGLAGFAIALFSNLWSGWWYLFDFVLAALAFSVLVEIVINLGRLKEGIWPLLRHSRLKKFISIGAVLFLTTMIFCSVTIGFSKFWNDTFRGAIGFTIIKAAALPSLWPNVFTTVAELNPASFGQVVNSVGGQLMFIIALLGMLMLLLRRDANGKFDVTYSALLAIWFVGTIYASLKGLRFTLLLGPAFAVAFGAAAGLLCQRLSVFGEKQLHINKIAVKVLIIVILGLIIINPTKSGTHMVRDSYASVVGDVPLVNDAWWNALTKIKDDSQPNAIINSWWDFGHHFKFIADRAVTSDGATQNSPQAHWIGRALQTDNEDEAVAILRMLDCGANLAYDFALNATNDPLKAIKLVKEIIMQDKETAAKMADEAGVSDILKYTHCDPPEDYFIASSDMIGKSGVWAHFGLWSFERAEIWQKWVHLEESEAVPKMVERFNWSKETAEQLYRDANALSSEDAANQWISPWPGYVSTDPSSCSASEGVLNCGNIAVNLSNGRAEIGVNQGVAPAGKMFLYNKNGTKKEFSYAEGNANLAVVLWPTGSGMSALAAYSQVADSMFTRLYYMGGLGLKHFRPLTQERQLIGGMIYVWKVDWAGGEAYIPGDLLPKSSVESGAEVKLNYIGWTDDGKVFDSSIVGWQEKNVSQYVSFDSFETRPMAFVAGQGKLIPGFESGIQGMKAGETKTITIPPEEAYGTDPSKHPLGNRTLHFKIKIEFVQ